MITLHSAEKDDMSNFRPKLLKGFYAFLSRDDDNPRRVN